MSGGAPDPYIGRTLDKRYRIDRLIGRGGMGAVYEAHHIGLDRKVAVKFVLGGDADAKARFKREARAASKIDHEHVVHIYDVGVDETGVDFIAMELVEGTDLANALKDGPFDIARALHVARQLVAGLAAVHESGIVHRDIKPANIMLTDHDDGRDLVKIMDFGISKAVDRSGTAITLAGRIVGTPQYMAPEQLTGDDADPRSDLYAAALVIYEMLAGTPPFRGANTEQLVELVLTDVPKRLEEVNPSVPVTVARVIDRALDKVPSERYQTAEALLAALDGNVGRVDSQTVPARLTPASGTTGPQTRPTKVEGPRRIVSSPSDDPPTIATPAKTNGRWPLLIAAVLVLGVPLGVFVAMKRDKAPAAAPTPTPPPIAVPIDAAAVDATSLHADLVAAQQADRDGRPTDAVAAYRRYLEAVPDARDAAQIVARIAALSPPVAPKPPSRTPSSLRDTKNRAPSNRAEACLCELRDAEGYTSNGCRVLASRVECSCGGNDTGLLCRVPYRIDEYDIRYCDPPNDVWERVKSGDACRGFDSAGTHVASQMWCHHCADGTFSYAGTEGAPCGGYKASTGEWGTGKLQRCGELPEREWR